MLLNVSAEEAHRQHISHRINLFRAAHFPCDELFSPYRAAQSQCSASWILLYSDGVTFKPILNFFSFLFFFFFFFLLYFAVSQTSELVYLQANQCNEQ